MAQLIMRWKNDGTPAQDIVIPDGCAVTTFPKLNNAMEKWLDIVQYGLSNGRCGADYYRKLMTDWPHYSDDKCFFLMEGDEAAATLTVVCDYEQKEGYIHMVACREGFRGKGYGTLLNNIAIRTLKDEGMETAHLTTDDWRIPAIKSYLRAGLVPDLSTEDFKVRWAKIYKQLGLPFTEI